jgi:hypothetical protein
MAAQMRALQNGHPAQLPPAGPRYCLRASAGTVVGVSGDRSAADTARHTRVHSHLIGEGRS